MRAEPAKKSDIEVNSTADRLSPPDVPWVERDGIRYSQATDGRAVGAETADGVLVATDISSGKRLWIMNVYHTRIDPMLEEDVQWNYFESMAFDADGRLKITKETGQVFLVDVKNRTVSAGQ